MEFEGSELSILIADDPEVAELNGAYRSKPRPTDVLSFPLQDDPEPGMHLGDIIISLPTALRQAKSYGVRRREELLRLLIHGTLHLLGYDHEKVSRQEANRMRSKERELYGILLPMVSPNVRSARTKREA